MVVLPQALPAAKVGFSVGLVQPTNNFNATLLQQQDIRPIGHQSIRQQNIPAMKARPTIGGVS